MKSSKEILIASSNKGKIKEFKKLLSNFQLYSMSDLNIDDPIEDGISFVENAIIKAKHGAEQSSKYTIADDSGIVIPDLNYEPGIYSARYAGLGATDKENRLKVINKLKEKNVESLKAYYVCVIVGLSSPSDPFPIVTQGEVHGKVSIISSGDGGFGYDKIFYPNNYSYSMATMDEEIKNKVSHRAIATKKFIENFLNYEIFS